MLRLKGTIQQLLFIIVTCTQTSFQKSFRGELQPFESAIFSYKFSQPPLIILETLNGDGDIFVKQGNENPSFDDYDLQSATTGREVIKVPDSFTSPLRIAVFAAKPYVNTTYYLTVASDDIKYKEGKPHSDSWTWTDFIVFFVEVDVVMKSSCNQVTRKRSRHFNPSSSSCSEEPLTPETPTKRKPTLGEGAISVCTREASISLKRKRFSSQTDVSENSYEVLNWIDVFKKFNEDDKKSALDLLSDICNTNQARYILKKIEPRFQRDFITLLPKELALSILKLLDPRDLLNAACTCKPWRVLCNDPLLWKDKCRQYDIPNHYFTSDNNIINWKKLFLTRQELDTNWRTGKNFIKKELKGHDDHVITCLQFHGDMIISGSDDSTLKVWSVSRGECTMALTGHTGGVWCSQYEDSILCSGSTDRTIRVWDVSTGHCLYTLYGHSSTVRCLSIFNKVVVSGSRDATLRIWDVRTGECKHVLIGHMAAVRCVKYDGVRVVSGAYDCLVKVWDPDTEACLHSLTGHTNRVYSLQFDGSHIVSGSLDTTIRVWDAVSGQCLHVLSGHRSLTSGMELKDNILVSGNADSFVKIWDISTGSCLQTLSGASKHQSAVTCLLFNKTYVLTSSDDGTVKLWDITTGEFIRDIVKLESGGSGGVVWRIEQDKTRLVCAVGSRNGTEETKLIVFDFNVTNKKALTDIYPLDVEEIELTERENSIENT